MDNLEIEEVSMLAGDLGKTVVIIYFGPWGWKKGTGGFGPVSPVHKVIRDSINYSLKNKDDFLF